MQRRPVQGILRRLRTEESAQRDRAGSGTMGVRGKVMSLRVLKAGRRLLTPPDRRGSKADLGDTQDFPAGVRRRRVLWSWCFVVHATGGWDQPTDEGPCREEGNCEIQA